MTSPVPDMRTVRTFSAALPAIFGFPSRAWNGRRLTADECVGARRAYHAELDASGSQWFAAQAAHEYLSREAW